MNGTGTLVSVTGPSNYGGAAGTWYVEDGRHYAFSSGETLAAYRAAGFADVTLSPADANARGWRYAGAAPATPPQKQMIAAPTAPAAGHTTMNARGGGKMDLISRPGVLPGGLGIGRRPMYSRAQLDAMANFVGDIECYPGVLFDTLTYPTTGADSLTAFDGTRTSPLLTNVAANGIPTGRYFVARELCLVPLNSPTATVADTTAGAINDLARLIRNSRGTWSFEIKDKPWNPIPLNTVGSRSRIGGMMESGRASATGAVLQVPNLDGGGFDLGEIVIPALTNFRLNFRFLGGADLVTVAADLPFQVQLHGDWYRPPA